MMEQGLAFAGACSFAFVLLERGASPCLRFTYAVLELVQALDGAFPVLRPLVPELLFMMLGVAATTPSFALIVGFSTIVVVSLMHVLILKKIAANPCVAPLTCHSEHSVG